MHSVEARDGAGRRPRPATHIVVDAALSRKAAAKLNLEACQKLAGAFGRPHPVAKSA
jgi:hypothetical protein